MKMALLIVSLATIPFVFDEAYALTTGFVNATGISASQTPLTAPPPTNCSTVGLYVNSSLTGPTAVILGDSDIPITCTKAAMEWDITSIPLNADIQSAIYRYSINGFVLNGTTERTCDVRHADIRPSTFLTGNQTEAVEQFWLDAENGTLFFDDWSGCVGNSTNVNQILPASVITDIRSKLAGGWFAMYFGYDTNVQNGTLYLANWNWTAGIASNDLEINYTLGYFPDAVDDLLISNVQAVTLDLDWTEPFLNGTLLGYQINFTSPQGQPETIIINDTGTSDTSFAVSGLTQLTPYSFRVGVWTNNTSNMTGNIANTTTITLGNFTVGFFDINATQSDARLFKFERIDISDTIVELEVTYPSAFNTSCNFYYKFAQKNDTYFNLPHVSLPATSEDRATFRFLDVDNEVINVRCTDENSGVNAPYLLTQTAFPLLQQFINFSDGTYGTQGNFGAIDLVTLGVIIVMMVGFNRVNESVGAIFAVIILGFFAFFDIVEWFSFMFGTFAVVIMLTIASTRKM